LLLEWRAGMESLSPSTINVRLSAVRKLVGQAGRAGLLGAEQAARLTDIPNISQKGTRLGNWLTREQAKELLAVPDRSNPEGQTRLRYSHFQFQGPLVHRKSLATLATVPQLAQSSFLRSVRAVRLLDTPTDRHSLT
jgi:hypothetical protein